MNVLWRAHTNPRVILDEDRFWIEENTNYPEGQGNTFLMYDDRRKSRIVCLGGVDKTGEEWVATISTPYDEETDSDATLIFQGDRPGAIEALWENRYNAYLQGET